VKHYSETFETEGGAIMSKIWQFFDFIGKLTLFGLKALRDAFRPPFEFEYFLKQIREIGWNSLSLILASGFALGIVMTLHTRSTLVQFGAEAEIPNFQSMSFSTRLDHW
jgi:phospholipid/cholesterol/gamma-HCH transport system permease protein